MTRRAAPKFRGDRRLAARLDAAAVVGACPLACADLARGASVAGCSWPGIAPLLRLAAPIQHRRNVAARVAACRTPPHPATRRLSLRVCTYICKCHTCAGVILCTVIAYWYTVLDCALAMPQWWGSTPSILSKKQYSVRVISLRSPWSVDCPKKSLIFCQVCHAVSDTFSLL